MKFTNDAEDLVPPNDTTYSLFLCGQWPSKGNHSPINELCQRLSREFFVTCNSTTFESCTARVKLSDVFILLVNEHTLADNSCIQTLQFAFNEGKPIIMVRPPRTKLIICKLEHDPNIRLIDGIAVQKASGLVSRNGLAIVKDSINYRLVQNILTTGYKHSVIFDRQNPKQGVDKLETKLKRLLSLGHDKQCKRDSIVSANGTDKENGHTNGVEVDGMEIVGDGGSEVSEATVELEQVQIDAKEATSIAANGITPLDAKLFSRNVSLDRSASSPGFDLANVDNFQSTQYLIFPLKDPSKKPKLIRFPQDLIARNLRDESIWGSDTSLEEEAQKIAPMINTGVSVDYEESPVASPRPYIDPI